MPIYDIASRLQQICFARHKRGYWGRLCGKPLHIGARQMPLPITTAVPNSRACQGQATALIAFRAQMPEHFALPRALSLWRGYSYNMVMVQIRPYAPADRDACILLFMSNVPKFFSADELDDFTGYLDTANQTGSYIVLEDAGGIVGCGGVAVEEDGISASLCWGMVDQRLHRSGLGLKLTEARMDAARAIAGVRQIRLDTSQYTQGFYARLGFETTYVTPDGYAPGLDRWDMLLRF